MRVSPLTLRWLGALGLAVTLLGAATWQVACVPLFNVQDPRWLSSHSDAEVCAEIARVEPIWGWSHDTSLLVGSCDSTWVGRILDEAKGPDSLDSNCVHLGSSLRLLTGQAIPENDLDAWRRWYARHRDESQHEWFRAAFADAGVQLPPVFTSADARVLLKWMGEKRSGLDPPGYVAFLLLRDQAAMREILINGPDSPLTPAELAGFRQFVIWNRDPTWGGAQSATSRWRHVPPCAMVVVALMSSFLLGWSLRRGTRNAS